MALVFADSFDHYTTVTNKWTSISVFNFASQSITSAAGKHGTNGLRCTTGGAASGSTAFKFLANPTPSGSTFICGFALTTPSTTNNTPIFRLYSLAGAAIHASMWLGPNGEINLYRGDGAALLGSTPIATLLSSSSYYIEWKVVLGTGTSGSMVLRINGVVALTISSVNTQGGATAAWEGIGIGTNNTNITADLRYDDLYVLDTSGSFNNDFLGEVRVDCHFPTANGNTSMSTPSTGSNRGTTLDETAQNGDTDYNTLAAVNDKDTLTLQDLIPTGAGTILGFQMNICAEKADAGAGIYNGVLRSAGTDYDDTQQIAPSNGSYSFSRIVRDTDPATSARMLEAAFNALEPGYKRTA